MSAEPTFPSWLLWAWGGIVALYFLLAPNVAFPELNWYDAQRFGQIGVFLLSALVWAIWTIARGAGSSVPADLLLGLLVLLGVISSLLSAFPFWAFMEMGLAAGMVFCALAARSWLEQGNRQQKEKLAAVFVLVWCAAYATIRCVVAGALAASGDGMTHEVFYSGFVNMRSLGQLQTMSVFFLAAIVLDSSFRQLTRLFSVAVLCVWCLGIVIIDTRGTYLAIAAVSTLLILLGPHGRRLSLLVIVALLCVWGIEQTVYWGLLSDASHGVLWAGRTSYLSSAGRLELWKTALDMIASHPLFGTGPMHFAALHHRLGAHPHNVVLQVFAEWGVIAGVLVSIGVGAATVRVVRRARQAPPSLIGLAIIASGIGALAQSLVDGVLVVPMSQLAIAVLFGWMLANETGLDHGLFSTRSRSRLFGGLLAFAGCGLLVFLCIGATITAADIDKKLVDQARRIEERPEAKVVWPRFWSAGFIP